MGKRGGTSLHSQRLIALAVLMFSADIDDDDDDGGSDLCFIACRLERCGPGAASSTSVRFGKLSTPAQADHHDMSSHGNKISSAGLDLSFT